MGLNKKKIPLHLIHPPKSNCNRVCDNKTKAKIFQPKFLKFTKLKSSGAGLDPFSNKAQTIKFKKFLYLFSCKNNAVQLRRNGCPLCIYHYLSKQLNNYGFFQKNAYSFISNRANKKLILNRKKNLRLLVMNFICFFLYLFSFNNLVADQSKTLIIKGDSGYPPFEYLNKRNFPEGFDIDIIKAVAKQMGFKIDIKLDSWHTVRDEIEQGEIDVLLAMFKTKNRDKLVDFSVPYFIASYAVFTRKDSKIKSLDDTHTKTIAVADNDLGNDYLIENNITQHIMPMNTVTDALLEVSKGNADCALISRLQGLIIVKKKNLKNVITVGAPIIQRDCCFAVKEGNAGLLAELNEGLSIIKKTGEYDRIYEKWFGVYERMRWGYQKILKYLFMFTTPLVVIIILVFLWSWSLKKSVAARTKELLKSRENLNITLNSIGDAVIATDINGNIERMNPIAEALTGWPLKDAKGKPLKKIFEIIHAYTREAVDNPVDKVLNTGIIVGLKNHTILISKDGHEFHITDSASPIKDATGKTSGVILVFRNCSEEYKLREQYRKMALLVESASSPIVMGTSEGKIIHVNPAFLRIWGYDRPEEVLGNYINKFWIIEDSITDVTNRIKAGESISKEAQGIKRDGTLFDILVSASEVQDSNGVTIAMMSSSIDITVLKKIEKTLKLSETRYRTLVENIPGVTYRCACDEHWTMEFFSNEIKELTGYQFSDFKNNSVRTYNSIIHPEDRQLVKDKITNKITQKKPFSIEYRIIHAKGKLRWVYEKGQGIFDGNGQLAYIDGVIINITDRKLTEQMLYKRSDQLSVANTELTRHKEQLENLVKERTEKLNKSLEELKRTQDFLIESEKMAALGGLVAGVGHEINTPVGVALTAASHLHNVTKKFEKGYRSDNLSSEEYEDYIDISVETTSLILSNLNRTAKLVNSFKQVAVDQSSEEQRQVNLKEYVNEILASIMPNFKKTDHEIIVKCTQEIIINTFPGAIYQILTNLLMNSLIHGFEGIHEGIITIEICKIDNAVKIIYFDTGLGIPKENISKIFDPFFTTKRGQGGSGLGLHITYNLITRTLCGTIQCSSKVGKGTRFELEFPCDQ